MMSNLEIGRASRLIAERLEGEFRKLGLEPEELGTVLPFALGLLLGRTTLEPQKALKYFNTALSLGLKERNLQ